MKYNPNTKMKYYDLLGLPGFGLPNEITVEEFFRKFSDTWVYHITSHPGYSTRACVAWCKEKLRWLRHDEDLTFGRYFILAGPLQWSPGAGLFNIARIFPNVYVLSTEFIDSCMWFMADTTDAETVNHIHQVIGDEGAIIGFYEVMSAAKPSPDNDDAVAPKGENSCKVQKVQVKPVDDNILDEISKVNSIVFDNLSNPTLKSVLFSLGQEYFATGYISTVSDGRRVCRFTTPSDGQIHNKHEIVQKVYIFEIAPEIDDKTASRIVKGAINALEYPHGLKDLIPLLLAMVNKTYYECNASIRGDTVRFSLLHTRGAYPMGNSDAVTDEINSIWEKGKAFQILYSAPALVNELTADQFISRINDPDCCVCKRPLLILWPDDLPDEIYNNLDTFKGSIGII